MVKILFDPVYSEPFRGFTLCARISSRITRPSCMRDDLVRRTLRLVLSVACERGTESHDDHHPGDLEAISDIQVHLSVLRAVIRVKVGRAAGEFRSPAAGRTYGHSMSKRDSSSVTVSVPLSPPCLQGAPQQPEGWWRGPMHGPGGFPRRSWSSEHIRSTQTGPPPA